jgi:hypothetical protein
MPKMLNNKRTETRIRASFFTASPEKSITIEVMSPLISATAESGVLALMGALG